MSLDGNDVDGALVLFSALTVCALLVLAVGYQVTAMLAVLEAYTKYDSADCDARKASALMLSWRLEEAVLDT